jgi:hypothetical protein
MHVEITIVAKDYDRGKQSTRKEEVEIPGRVLKLFEMFTGNDPDQLLRWVADTVFGTAVREVQGGGKSGNLTSAMESAGGGRIGGRSAPGENQAADNLAEHLGLDVIRRDVARTQRRAAPPPQQMALPQGPPMGPGPVGFGPPPQQQMGPGPIGYSADKPINPGPGPGPVGFGPDRRR